MKTIIVTSVILALFAFLYPVLMSIGHPVEKTEPPSTDTSSVSDTNAEDTQSAESTETTGEEQAASETDVNTMIKVLKSDGRVYDMSMRDYLISVVAAEMPVSFELEALKAQAVAARTYTLYNMLVRPSTVHSDADVCTNYECCKAYVEQDSLKEQWGDNYDEYIAKIQNAVISTDGEYLSYDDGIVLAVFHSSSAGKTENAEKVWNTQLPYLVSVDSPETPEEVPNFKTVVTVTHKDFVDTIKANYPDAYFGDDISAWVGETVNTDSGRVDYITIGGVNISGTDIRSMFGLRSAYFTLDLNSIDATFTVTGYGHGVGMSQYGANILAKEGKQYNEILAWYYVGTELKNAANLNIER